MAFVSFPCRWNYEVTTHGRRIPSDKKINVGSCKHWHTMHNNVSNIHALHTHNSFSQNIEKQTTTRSNRQWKTTHGLLLLSIPLEHLVEHDSTAYTHIIGYDWSALRRSTGCDRSDIPHREFSHTERTSDKLTTWGRLLREHTRTMTR